MTHLLIDISNSFTKVVVARAGQLGEVRRVPTPALTTERLVQLVADWPQDWASVVVASVVPARTPAVRAAFPQIIHEVGPHLDLGLRLHYPRPEEIGADRLANAVACRHHVGHPAIVVDFGTAVTFDVISPEGDYLGGVIAPGLQAMTDYLHEKTALLPKVELMEPPRVVGQSTREAMLSGAVHGYRGLIREIIAQIRAEAFGGGACLVAATGGHAELIGQGLPLFDCIDPLLTLRGLWLLAERQARATEGQPHHKAGSTKC